MINQGENDTILVSVIVPVKNRAIELKRALQSVLNQTLTDFEVLVIDDKSKEDIRGVIAEFNDARIKYLLNEQPVSNANVCRNIGLDAAEGKYVAMLDSDDEWLSHHLQSKLDFLNNHKCEGVFGSAYVDDGESKVLRLSRPKGKSERMLDYLLTTGRAPTPTHFYLAESAKKIRWDSDLNRHQDFDFSARFDEQFSFLACEEPTAIIHWKKGEKRAEHIASQIIFYQKHRKRISPDIRVKYLTETYSRIVDRQDIPKEQRQFFRSQSLKQIRFMSFADFSLLSNRKSRVERLLHRIEYVIRFLF